MPQLNVSLPPQLKQWIDSRVAEGRFSSASDYVRHLVRQDEDRTLLWEEDTARLRRLIEEGEASGISDEDPFELIDKLIAARAAAE